MTANQIAYMQLQESRLHNRNVEAESHRTNVENENIKKSQLYETNRSNLVNESIRTQQNIEQHRTNVANETLQQRRNAETERSNRANEVIKLRELAETQRSNKANEAIRSEANSINRSHYERIDAEQQRNNIATLNEVIRHNLRSEDLSQQSVNVGRLQAQASLQQASAAMRNADTAYSRMVHDNLYQSENAIWFQTYADAAMMNAEANKKNADTNADNAGTNRFNAAVNAADKGNRTKVDWAGIGVDQQNADTNKFKAWTGAINNAFDTLSKNVKYALDLSAFAAGGN